MTIRFKQPGLSHRKAEEAHIEEFFCFLNRDVSRNNPGFIDEIDVESTVEIGKKKKRVHLHSLIGVKHRTKLQVDLRMTHAFFWERFQLKNTSIKSLCQIKT